jgi:hypothetical protein
LSKVTASNWSFSSVVAAIVQKLPVQPPDEVSEPCGAKFTLETLSNVFDFGIRAGSAQITAPAITITKTRAPTTAKVLFKANSLQEKKESIIFTLMLWK